MPLYTYLLQQSLIIKQPNHGADLEQLKLSKEPKVLNQLKPVASPSSQPVVSSTSPVSTTTRQSASMASMASPSAPQRPWAAPPLSRLRAALSLSQRLAKKALKSQWNNIRINTRRRRVFTLCKTAPTQGNRNGQRTYIK